MAAALSNRGMRDRAWIDMGQESDVQYWMRTFRVSRAQLAAAVRMAGTSAQAVERTLGARRPVRADVALIDGAGIFGLVDALLGRYMEFTRRMFDPR